MDPITIAAFIGGCLGLIGMGSAWGQQGYSQYHATQLQNDAQKFNAQQAELNREWQEEMYLKYNSLSGKIAQAKEAGVNPLFAVTGNSVMPAPSSSTPASSGVGSPGAAPSSLGAVTQLMDVLSNIKLKDAQAKNIDTDTAGKEIDNSWKDRMYAAQEALTWKELDGIQNSIEVGENRILVGNAEIEVLASQATLNAAATAMKGMEMDRFEKLTPLVIEYQEAKNETERAEKAVLIAQEAGIKAATSKTETDESLGIASEVREGVVDTVTTGVLIADFVGEVLGVEDMGHRWTEHREIRNRKGDVIGTETRTREGDARKTSKKKRKRRR